MAVTFIEPGGDADFGIALWASKVGSPAVATDFVHGTHVKSLTFPINTAVSLASAAGVAADAGTRFSAYLYVNAYPAANAKSLFLFKQSGGNPVFAVSITTAGVLQVYNSSGVQIGTNGGTISTGKWTRVTCSFTITSTTVNRFELFINGVSSISITNATLARTATSLAVVGIAAADTALDFRVSDVYVDSGSTLDDTGDVWVTAKRPNANGTTNGFTTQIGSGGSGYGTGHSPQVNERPLSTTNGWSMVGAGSAVTEEYTVEGAAVGDMVISAASLVDYMGWVYASAALAETGSIVVGGASSNIALTNTNTAFVKMAGSTTYPGGGTDIGIVTSTTVTTVSLYECGLIMAFLVSPAEGSDGSFLGRTIPDDTTVGLW